MEVLDPHPRLALKKYAKRRLGRALVVLHIIRDQRAPARKRQSGSFDILQVGSAREYRKGFRAGLKDCVAAATAMADWRALEGRRMKKLVSMCHGSIGAWHPARERVWDSSIYGSGVPVIRRRAKSGAEHDGVGPMPAKVRVGNENEGTGNIAPKGLAGGMARGGNVT
ncbi:hypothetical protein X777_09624 [Ooceraea biroi]|uniref:Uncharacterized protein n=1 Tax=Ooceraea biroi TaxID=2015173 RepID=A0A026W9X9_OOCBI|nr:hypothetical protein X777_09624 [Ooceraea biroi]